MILLRIAAALAAVLFLAAAVVRCSNSGKGGEENSRALTISPAAVTLRPGESNQFSASPGRSMPDGG